MRQYFTEHDDKVKKKLFFPASPGLPKLGQNVQGIDLLQGFHDQLAVGGFVVLDKSAMHLAFPKSPGNVDGLSRKWLLASMIHASRHGHGSGYEILNLFGADPALYQVQGHLKSFSQRAAGVGGYEIINHKKFLTGGFTGGTEPVDKVFVNRELRLVHQRENLIGAMLRGDFKQAADMMAAEFFKIHIPLRPLQQVETQTAAGEHMFNAGNPAQTPIQADHSFESHLVPRADLRYQALLI